MLQFKSKLQNDANTCEE